MTSRTVTEINQYFKNVTGNVNAKKNNSDAFMDCFSQAYGGQSGAAVQQPESIKTPQKNENLQAKPEYHQDKLQTKQPNSTDKIVKDTTSDKDTTLDKGLTEGQDITQEVEEAAEEIIEAVASQLGISIETVRAMMEQSGMSPADLLDPEQVTQLMLNLSGDASGLDLLTNAELYGDVEQVMKKLDDVLGQLAQELQVDPEQLQTMIRDAGEAMNAEADGRQEVQDDPEAEQIQQPEKQPQQSAMETAQAGEKANETRQTDTQEEPVITVENEKPLETVTKQTDHSSQNGGKENSGKENQKGQTESGQTNLEHLNAQAAGKTDMNAIVQELTQQVHHAPDTEQIMRQIMDYMKVQVKADMTQMEIQLHPSSLGNVNVQISAREGVITAQFTAQNETVKAALETQIIQLKETLAEQGVKVEAIEVTIASHSFERNLQQNGGQDAEDAQQDKKKGPKRLNLNLAEGEEMDMEEMDDADKIAADMMARNGNTVDFSA